jgi:L-fuconolactonase
LRIADRESHAMTATAAVDGHVHFWNPARVPLSWLRPEHGVLNATFEPADLLPLLAPTQVTSAIVVQSACLDADTMMMLQEARVHDWIAAVVGWLPLRSPVDTERRLAELEGCSRLRGVRHLTSDEEDPHWILQPAVLSSLELVAASGLLLELPAEFPQHLEDVPTLVRAVPDLTLVVDHLGKPPLDGRGFGEWERQLRAAAAGPNVYAKISGLYPPAPEAARSEDYLTRAVSVAMDAFGARRLLCGSDWPVALLHSDYGSVWSETRRVLDAVAPDDREQLLALTALRLYGIDQRESVA